MVNSQTCHIKLDCVDNGTYTSPDLVFTKIQKNVQTGTDGPEKQQSNVKMATLLRIRKRTAANKRSIGKLERQIKHVEDINKLTVKKVNAQLRKQLLLNAELQNKLQNLYG